MPTLLTMHAPIYRKKGGNASYTLEGFYNLKANVHENAPMSHVWNALKLLGQAPVAVFCAGDKTSYMLLDGGVDIQEVWNARFDHQYNKALGWEDSNGYRCIDFKSSVVFTDRGFLCCVPVPDHCYGFLESVPGALMREQLRREAQRLRTAYQRLRDNVQFLDMYQGQILGCQRLEGGRVGYKRKRNVEEG